LQVRAHNEFFLGFSVSRPLVGKTVQKSGLRQLPNAFLVAIDRGATTLHAVSPDEVLEADDVLWFAGEGPGTPSCFFSFPPPHPWQPASAALLPCATALLPG
jgi:uncharacterized protein with PhoU and TrkA domain